MRTFRAAGATLLLALSLLLSPQSFSPAFAAHIQKGPYLQNVTRDSIVVCWETDRPAPGEVVYHPGGRPDKVVRVESPWEVEHHCVPLTGLETGAGYEYYVKVGGIQIGTRAFRTAPEPGKPFRFVAYGDCRSHEDRHRAVVDAIVEEDPAFVLNTGDVVDKGSEPTHWARFFRGARPLLRTAPYYVAIGNHEKNHPDYFRYFVFPGSERYYSFDYAGAHFIALDSNMPFRMDPKQKAWLKADLKEHRDAILTFVFFHHPPYSSGKHGSDLQMRNLYEKIFQKGGVDVVFNGHDRSYERAEPPGGIVYVVTGGGGAELRDVGRNEWTRSARRTYHYVVVDVRDGKWFAEARNQLRKTIDTFSGAGR